MRFPRVQTALLIAGIAGLSAEARANLLGDGSFEQSVISGDNYLINPFYPDSGTYWQGGVLGITSKPIPGFFGPTQYGLPAAEDGNQYVELADNVVISQSVVPAASGLYTLTWWDNLGVPDGPPDQLGISPHPQYTVSVGGATYGYVPVATQGWTKETLQFTLVGGTSSTIGFQGPPTEYGNSFDAYNWLLLDNVDLEGPSPAGAVPDGGATAALMAAALTGLAALRGRFGK